MGGETSWELLSPFSRRSSILHFRFVPLQILPVVGDFRSISGDVFLAHFSAAEQRGAYIYEMLTFLGRISLKPDC